MLVVFGLVISGRFAGKLVGRYLAGELDKLYDTTDAPLGVNEQEFVVGEQVFDAQPSGTARPMQAYGEQTVSVGGPGKLTDWSDIAGVAPARPVHTQQQRPVAYADFSRTPAPTVQLNGNESVNANLQASGMGGKEEGGQIVMISAPVKWLLIRNLDEYKEFKRRARGGYPTVDFTKQMLVVLESDSNFPDNVFEIVSAEKQDGALVVSYRVNILGLDKKINSHTVLPVQKTQLPIALKQVL